MVKNYLVCAIRPITNTWMDKSGNDLHQDYLEMHDIRMSSFKKFVKEPFEEILWTDPVADNEEYTKANWQATLELKKNGPCNIFWAGADTLMIKPTSLFDDRFKEYRLFNYTDPKSHNEFKHYFNDDVSYYPHTMSKEIWSLGEQWWNNIDNHPDRDWGFDQLRHNAMFWSQDIPESDRLHPEMAYQAMNLRVLNQDHINWHDQWNGISINQAHIVHFHGSRGSKAVINIMKEFCNQLGIQT